MKKFLLFAGEAAILLLTLATMYALIVVLYAITYPMPV
tara:strand:+ start:531 stop:644 length:114 start_codon:yes stop_codon:yes gene_type:complete